MAQMQEIKEVKAALRKVTRYADNFELFVKVYDCDEDGEQTYDVEAILYVEGKYIDTWVTDRYYEGEEKVAMKRARAVRTSLLKDYETIPAVGIYTP